MPLISRWQNLGRLGLPSWPAPAVYARLSDGGGKRGILTLTFNDECLSSCRTASMNASTSQPLTPWQAWLSMFGIQAPLSGDVTQDIAPSIGGQLGLLNINATRSGDPELEQRIITQVASYGRQLGWLVEAVDVLARRHPRRGLTGDRTSARWINSTSSPSRSWRSRNRQPCTRSTASSLKCRR